MRPQLVMGFSFNRQSRQIDDSSEPMANHGGSQLRTRPAFLNWNPGWWDADGDNQPELRDQRSYARSLDRESPAARAAFNQKIAYRVSTGLRLQAKTLPEWVGISPEEAEKHNKKVEEYFKMWAEDPRASVEGDENWYEMQRKIALSETISGDIFTLLVRKKRRNWPFQTALQLIEADRVCNENNKANGDGLYEGIERAKKDGEILAIWVAKYHPGRRIVTPAQEWSRIPIYGNLGRRNVLHRKQTRRPGETRGMPVISVITGIIKQFTRYTEAEIEAAVNAAAQVLLAEMNPESFKDLFTPAEQEAWKDGVTAARNNTTDLVSGRILNLLPGERVTSPTPGRPNPNFGLFAKNFYTLLGMGLTMPPETLTGLYESSYTAARAAILQLWQTIDIQRQDDETHTCQPTYETWLGDCVSDGIISCPGFFDNAFVRHGWCNATWTGTGQASLNPLDEAKAAEIRARFLTSEAEEAQNYDGGDYEERHLQRAREARKRREDGLPPLGVTDTATAPATLATGDTIAP